PQDFMTSQPSLHANVGVGVIIRKDGKILLMKRTGSHGEGTWSCPGGHIDFGESLEQTAVRETKEEVGIDIVDVKFKAITNDVFPDDQKHYITVWMEGYYSSGNSSINSARKLTEVDWFDLDNLPQPLFVPLQNLVEGKSYPKNVLK
ncbi:MAG: NUDIX domain-containing protein, partial [Candidatus Andersenbacteria bacterium]